MPIIAVAKKLNDLLGASREIPDFLFIGSDSPFNEVITNFGIPIKTVSAYKIRRYQASENFTEFINLPVGIMQALWHVYLFMPDVVFSKGGYASFPVVLAAWIFRIPIMIHESDSIAGVSNYVAGKMADKIAISYVDAGNYFSTKKLVFTGNPVRQDVLTGDRDRAIEGFGLNRDLPTILILGGSQGAQKINNIVLELLPKLVARAQVIHQCGVGNYKEVKQAVESQEIENIGNYHLYPFLYDNISDAYAVSDLVISRAGANNIAEIINLGKPVILIPLSGSAGGHQMKNASYFSSKGAALLMDETNLTPNMLYDAVFGILDDREKQIRMIKTIRSFAKFDAAELIAEEVIKLGR